MTNTEIKEEILKNAYQNYLDYWIPIDIACNSCLSIVGYDYFLIRLLTFDDKYFDRFVKIQKFSKSTIKKYILYKIC